MQTPKIINAQYWKPATETRTLNQTILDFSLARITFLNTHEKEMISRKDITAEDFSLLEIADIEKLVSRNFPKPVWNGKENLSEAKKQVEICRRFNIGFLKITDSEYPAMLKTLSNPPFLLFYRGSLEAFNQKSISVVGTRQITADGKKAALDFSKAASLSGVAVVSGLAKGADSFAHKGALEAYFDRIEEDKDTSALGKTIAVLPCAIDEITPSIHKKLAENIIKSGGCIISEYGPRILPANWHFVQRNRIIAALSPATVVVEAPNGSGALITVDFALEIGRDVMFHKACFGENAQKINEGVKQNLENQYNNKLITKHKLEVSCEQFVRDGAPVIENYEDYCRCISEVPGTRSANKIQQLSLFD